MGLKTKYDNKIMKVLGENIKYLDNWRQRRPT